MKYKNQRLHKKTHKNTKVLSQHADMIDMTLRDVMSTVMKYFEKASKMLGIAIMQDDIDIGKRARLRDLRTAYNDISIAKRFEKKIGFYEKVETNCDELFVEFFGFKNIDSPTHGTTFYSEMTRHAKYYLKYATEV